MAATLPPRLAPGDELRVVAPSRSPAALREWAGFGEADVAFARGHLEGMGLRVSFGRRWEETGEGGVAPAEARLADLHDAFRDDAVRAILALSGGNGSIALLEGLDFGLAAAHPKALVGYSDVGHLHLALLARAGLAGYSGPNFTGFAMRKGFEATAAWFRDCLFASAPLEIAPAAAWSDDDWLADQENRTFHPHEGLWCLREGAAEGTIVGAGLHALNALQGTPFFPALAGAVLFLESPGEGRGTLLMLDGALRSLAMQPGFGGVAGLVLGRFPSKCRATREGLRAVVDGIAALRGIPVLANADFGHTTPAMTLPIGGTCRIAAAPGGSRLALLRH